MTPCVCLQAIALVVVTVAMVMVWTTTPVGGADAAGTMNQREKRDVALLVRLLRLTGLDQKLGLNRGSGSAYKSGPNYGPRGLAFVNPTAYGIVAPGVVYGSYGAGYAGAGFGPVPTVGTSFGPFPVAGEWNGLAPVAPGPDASWPLSPPTAVVYGPSPVHGPDVGSYD